ncbi:hypothetical protein [Kaarinaea lacus]
MKVKLVLLLLLFVMSYTAGAEVVTGTDDIAQLPFWEWRNDYMTVRLVQRLPDQTRAYFSGRGFQPSVVKIISGFCIFQTVYTNTTSEKNKRVVEHDVRDWRYRYKGKDFLMKPREDWKYDWQDLDVAQPQIVAFEWSLFPTRQTFQAGDYNWGMSVFKVNHGDSFDFELNWIVDGMKQTATIPGITCAKDIYIPPQQGGS